jgi:hypothetical protein
MRTSASIDEKQGIERHQPLWPPQPLCLPLHFQPTLCPHAHLHRARLLELHLVPGAVRHPVVVGEGALDASGLVEQLDRGEVPV